VLSRDLAHAGHYPAVDVLASVSRLVGEVTAPEVRAAGNEVRKLMAAYKDKADLIAIGAYQPGTDALTDAAIAAREPIDAFLRQTVEEHSTAEEADAALSQLTLLAGADMAAVAPPPAAPAAPSGPGTPLHAAIPPLHIAA
jgi:flagellum-specific ATP synthase